MGAVPGRPGSDAADDTGYVDVVDVDSQGSKGLTYRTYADPTHPRVPPDGGNNWWISRLTLSGPAINWASLERTQPAKRSFVVRPKTDGSAPVRLSTAAGLRGFTRSRCCRVPGQPAARQPR